MVALIVTGGDSMVRSGPQHLSWRQRVWVHVIGWSLLASGVTWLALHYLLGAGSGELPHPMESWTMRLHALAAWSGTFLLGHLAAGHIPRGWHATRRARGQRRLGLALCVLGAAIVLSGYALMYLVPEPSHAAWGWAHAIAGTAMAAVLLVHGSGVLHRRAV